MKTQTSFALPRIFSRARKNLVIHARSLAVGAATLGMSMQAYASSSGGLPWDGPLATIAGDLTGPVATATSVVAFFAAGAALVFQGDEMGSLAKRLLYVVLGVAVMVMGNKALSVLGLTGALIY